MRVLVTNNMNARDAFGDPSHIWYGSPRFDAQEDAWSVYEGGQYLTHWMDPFATPKAFELPFETLEALWKNGTNDRVFMKGSMAHAFALRIFEAQNAASLVAPTAQAAVPQDERGAPWSEYFVYDPSGGYVEFYESDAQREKAHNDAIAEYRKDSILDGEWSLDVESVVSGVVTHKTVAIADDGESCDYEARATSTSANVAQGAEAKAEAPMADAYVGAREDLSIWKKRALEAEELNRKFMASVNGPTHMGEPVVAAPIYAYEWDCGPGVVHRDFQYCSYNGRYPDRTLTLYATPPAQTAQPAVVLDDERAARLTAEIKELVRQKPTAVNAYGLKSWETVERKIAEALAATVQPDQPTPSCLDGGEDAVEMARNDGLLDPECDAELHPDTAKLVRRFARSLANKLRMAQRKYGYTNNWTRDDWADECRAELMRHIQKGDPRDVAVYCAFLWHHDWQTTPVKVLEPCIQCGVAVDPACGCSRGRALASQTDALAAAAQTCQNCKGNDAGMPCAFPGDGKPGCLRDARMEPVATLLPEDQAAALSWAILAASKNTDGAHWEPLMKVRRALMNGSSASLLLSEHQRAVLNKAVSVCRSARSFGVVRELLNLLDPGRKW